MATTITKTETLVGKRIRRREDPRLITGTATYVDDIQMPGMLHACIVRSPHGAAKIKSINVRPAVELPGVQAVFTGKDTEKCPPVPCGASLPGLRVPYHHLLAIDRVYLVGHPVAVVVATDRYIARDAADLVEVEYEPLPAVNGTRESARTGRARRASAMARQYRFYVSSGRRRGRQGFRRRRRGGEGAHHQPAPDSHLDGNARLCRRLAVGRQVDDHPPHHAVPAPGPHAAGRHAGLARKSHARCDTRNRRRIRKQNSGLRRRGSDGLRRDEARQTHQVDREPARKLHRHHPWPRARRLLRDRGQTRRNYSWHQAQADSGSGRVSYPAHARYTDVIGPDDARPLQVPEYSSRHCRCIYQLHGDRCLSRRGPSGSHTRHRAHGRHSRGRAETDPAEIRFKNFIGKDEFPYATATGLSYDSGNYAAPLQKALDTAGYKKLREEQKDARAQGRLFGIGMSAYGEICAFGPSAATPAGGWESATVKIEPGGTVTVMTGASPHGQGEETTFAQIAADELGVGIDDVLVLHGDTAIVQYGIGTFGSRGTALGGTAMYYAIQELKEKIKKYGAMLLESDDVSYSNGACVCNKTGKSMGLPEIASATYRAMKLPPNTEPGLLATYFWEPPNFTFPFGAHIVVTEVDRDTGAIALKRYIAVDDCGKIINPLIVDGQVHGGVVQGLGQALWEQAVYDDSGQLVTGELMDYAIPKASNIPWLETSHTETPSPVNPLGVKGVGEAGTIGCSPAVVNSVVDALSPLGVRHIDMPLTPEKIWNLVQAGGRA